MCRKVTDPALEGGLADSKARVLPTLHLSLFYPLGDSLEKPSLWARFLSGWGRGQPRTKSPGSRLLRAVPLVKAQVPLILETAGRAPGGRPGTRSRTSQPAAAQGLWPPLPGEPVRTTCYSVTPSLLGYSVASISTGTGVHFVAGAPRANYTGQIVLYRVSESGNVTVVQAHRGDQVESLTEKATWIAGRAGAGGRWWDGRLALPEGLPCDRRQHLRECP